MSSKFLKTDDNIIVRRSPRARQLTLRVDGRSGAAMLTLPRWVSATEAAAFVNEHQGWIARQRAALPPIIPFAPGNEVPILGAPHRIVHDAAAGRKPALDPEAATLRVGGEESEIANRVRRYLRARAGEEIAPRAARYAEALGVSFSSLRLTDPKGIWASCSTAGRLSFSWRVIMAPAWILDYLVAHEVSHLREMNHSRRFWAHVRTLVGDPAKARAWLNREGLALQRMG